MSNNAELNPCKFCASKGRLVECMNSDFCKYNHCFFVECECCRARTKNTKTAKEACDLWNRSCHEKSSEKRGIFHGGIYC